MGKLLLVVDLKIRKFASITFLLKGQNVFKSILANFLLYKISLLLWIERETLQFVIRDFFVDV